MLKEFNNFLVQMVGQPYLWGGTGTKLTPDNYEKLCRTMEKNTGNNYAEIAMEFCRKRFDEGAQELRAFDCSGLMRYWVQNHKGMYSGKTNAEGFYRSCKETEEPVPGCWLFRFDSSRTKATHIGYMTEKGVVHAKGRAYGVVLEDYEQTRGYWHAAGFPECFANEINGGQDPDEEGHGGAEENTGKVVMVKGDVRVRLGPGTDYEKIGTAHKGSRLVYIGTDYATGWHKVKCEGKTGYISGKLKYTEVTEA